MRILLPAEDSNSNTQSAIDLGCAATSSTNVGLAAFFGESGIPSSRSHSPTAADGQPNTNRIAGAAPWQPAKARLATSSDAAACCETHLTVVATARLEQERAMRFC